MAHNFVEIESKMFERIITLFDSFKENQLSKLLHSYRLKMLATIRGPQFSSQIQPYFAHANNEGLPFDNFEHEPKQVKQIKDVLNALFHANKAFLDVEKLDFSTNQSTKEGIKNLYYSTIHHTYQAAYLLTHLDVELGDIFANEIKLLLPLLTGFHDFAQNNAQGAADFTAQLKQYPIGYNIGLVSGVAVVQMKPKGEKFNYSFITQFGAVLPGYIQQLTALIYRYSPQQLANFQPSLDQKKLNTLQTEGAKLLHSLEHLKGEGIFLSVNLVYYVDVIERLITLSLSTLEQIVNLNESSQEIIRENLRFLKYELIAPLLALTDRIEDEALLTPGTLSSPLLANIEPCYKYLLSYIELVVDFNDKDQELLTIEDDHFVKTRLEETEQRVHKSLCTLIKIEKIQEEFTLFFNLLNKASSEGYKYLQALPQEYKAKLISHYKLLEPYLKKLDFDLNNQIINALMINSSWLGTLSPWRLLSNNSQNLRLTQVLCLQERLKKTLESAANTEQFHIILNVDIINSTYDKAKLNLYPYKKKLNNFACDEASVLRQATTNDFKFYTNDGDSFLAKTNTLTTDQAYELYCYYSKKIADLYRAQSAYVQFMKIVRTQHPKVLQHISHDNKVKLGRLYGHFQPYLVDISYSKNDYDGLICDILMEKLDLPDLSLTTNYFLRIEDTFLNKFEETANKYEKQADLYRNIAGVCYQTSKQQGVLKPDNSMGNRTDYLLQHKNYSKAIKDFRTSLSQLTALFNKTARKQLEPDSGLPFPELTDANSHIAQSKQLLGVKHIFNSLYYLEQITKQLEALNNKSSETIYVLHLGLAYQYVEGIVLAAQELYKDPYFALIASDLIQKATAISAMLIGGSEPFIVSSETIPLHKDDEKRDNKQLVFGALWYPLNAFMLIPEKLSKRKAQSDLAPHDIEKIQAHTKKVALDIEAILANTNSYFKLFLKSPVMYTLFMELKEKLKEFTDLSHGAVLSCLNDINTDLFTRILIETDMHEDRIGLQPGLLSGPMKHLLDEFYKGLIEPLGLPSKKQFELISTENPTAQRIAAVKQRREEAQVKKAIDNQNLELMSKLMNLMSLFTAKAFPETLSKDLIKEELISCYKMTLPILYENRGLYSLTKYSYEKSPQIDALIDSKFIELTKQYIPVKGLTLLYETKSEHPHPEEALPIDKSLFLLEGEEPTEEVSPTPIPKKKKHRVRHPIERTPQVDSCDENLILLEGEEPITIDYTPSFLDDLILPEKTEDDVRVETELDLVSEAIEEIEYNPYEDSHNVVRFCRIVFNYYKGLVTTNELDIQSSREKEDYLRSLTARQPSLNYQFIIANIQKSIHRQVQSLVKRDIGLKFVHQEYHEKLANYIEDWTEHIIESAKESKDIETAVREIIKSRVKRFDQANYQNYAHLDALREALQQFTNYCDKVNTKKTSYESKETLEAKYTLVNRLLTISQNPTLSVKERIQKMQDLTRHKQFEKTMLAHAKPTSNWLARLVKSFLQLLHLYTPEYVKHYQQLKKTIITRPTNRYKLFETPEPEPLYSLPQPRLIDTITDDVFAPPILT